MKSRCTICNHPLVNDINLAVLSGDYTLDELSQNFGPSRSAFHRHKGHLEKKMARTLERLENHRKQASFFKLSAFLDHVQTRVEAAAADGDTDRVYKGSHIGCRLIHQINKMDVPLEPDTAYRLLSSPGLVASDSLLPAGPQIIADLHQTLRDKTLAPCPPAEDDEDDVAAENQVENRPDLEKELLQFLAGLETSSPPPQTAQASRPNQHPLRKKLRQQKYILNGKILPKKSSAAQALNPDANVANVGRDPQGGESQSEAHPAAPAIFTSLGTRNPELETAFSDPRPLTTDHCSVPPDHFPAEASSSTKAPQPERDKSATNAKHRRRLLRKMLRNQKYIVKAKKLVQNLILGRPSDTPPAKEEALLPPVPLETRNPELETPPADPSSLIPDPWLDSDPDLWLTPGLGPTERDSAPLETRNPTLETPLLEPETPLLTTPKQEPEFEPEICLLETPNQKLKTKNRLPETANRKPKTENWLLKTANRLLSKPKPPPPYDESARRADELLEISHGYKRHNPPKHIPDRRRDEDFRSRTIFGDVNNTLKHMLG